MAEDTRVRKKISILTYCMRSRSISVTSGPFMVFSGYLLQPLHRSTVVFPCVLHGGVVAMRSFQVSFVCVLPNDG